MFAKPVLRLIKKGYNLIKEEVKVVVLTALGAFLAGLALLAYQDSKSLNYEELEPFLGYKTEQVQAPLERSRREMIALRPCEGELIDIMEDLEDVLGEKFVQANSQDPSEVKTPDKPPYQSAKRYPYGCNLPWVATVSATPLKEESLGLFIEYEDVFKFVLGDGDRETLVIEKNDGGRRGEGWSRVDKSKLGSGEVALNKELTFTVEADLMQQGLLVSANLNYWSEDSNQWEVFEYESPVFVPLGVNLKSQERRKFRLGINDFRFKGTGSLLRLQTFRIRQLEGGDN